MSSAQMTGTVTIVQEGRFQLIDDQGVAHLFILAPGASIEPAGLAQLQKRQAWVTVSYSPAQNIIGNVAHRIASRE